MKNVSVIINVFLAVLAGVLLFKLFGGESQPVREAEANDAYENIMSRTSIRAYKPGVAVADTVVEKLLRAAMAAPTAMNRQPWEFVAVNDTAILHRLAEALPYAKMTAHAPLAIVVCGNMQKALEGDSRQYWIQDTSAATQNILLAANSMGLGAVWTGVYPSSERVAAVSEILLLPENVVPLALIPVGYPDEPAKPKDKWKPENIHVNGW